jgi:hypothetical protein
MSTECERIHKLVNDLKRYDFPFDEAQIPVNGIYVLFEKGETGHKQDRIVRIGSHTGDNQLCNRLKQHFINQNKDRSIFRKNIGRALLNQNNDPFLECWDLDLTTRKAKERYSGSVDFEYQQMIEDRVSRFIQDNFSFCVFELRNREERLGIESNLISTVSLCLECGSSEGWLGNVSTKRKIRESGLWLVNELYKTPFDAEGVERLSRWMGI